MAKSKQQYQDRLAYSKVLAKGAFNPNTYEYSDEFRAGDPNVPLSVHTMAELHECLRRNDKVGFDGITIASDFKGNYSFKRITREGFLSAWKRNQNRRLKESTDYFGTDGYTPGKVGEDFVPLLGGPFNKQLYYHDALRMFALCFQAYNHDPIAHAFINILCDFVIGRGFRVDAKHSDPATQQRAQAFWEAFETVNDLQSMAIHLVKDSSRDGEILLWKLPNNATKIGYQLSPGQEVPKGIIPRWRLIDPSTCWEIVTYPEDITRVLFYQLVFPTQYQIYTGSDGGSYVPSTKFIIQQIPADQVKHYKLNCAYNEKRGRSDLYPILGYLKRLRDSVDYSLIAMQKASAYSIDTTVEGSQADVDGYVSAQEAQGTIHPAGSEFVHTKKITRQYLSNQASQGGSANPAFDWALNMACAGFGIPVSYLGTHMSGSQNRASALVGTEPVAKRFQSRQRFIERIVRDLGNDLMKHFGIEGVEWEITFPEIITQDRSAKIKDIITIEDAGYITKARAAEMCAKEMDISEYDYESEAEQIAAEKDPPIPTVINPLTAAPQAPAAQPAAPAPAGDDQAVPQNDNPGSAQATAVTQNARRKLSMNYGA